MSKQRRHHSTEFKFKVALEGAKGQKTINELASAFTVHPSQVSQWKQVLLDDGERLFRQLNRHAAREAEARQSELYEQIGRLKMELEWLKKKVAG